VQIGAAEFPWARGVSRLTIGDVLQKILQLLVLSMFACGPISSLNRYQVNDCAQIISWPRIDKGHRLLAKRSAFKRKLREVELHNVSFNGQAIILAS
jgi:hypothetical protein